MIDTSILQVMRWRAVFSVANVAILAALLAGGCSRKEPAKEVVATDSAPAAQAPAADAQKEEPPANLTERLARERFTGDLDEMVKRRFIRVLVVSDRTSLFFDGNQMRGIMYEVFHDFEAAVNKKYKTGQTPVKMIFLPVDRDRVSEVFAEGRGDILGKSAAITEEWKKYADFSDPIRENISYLVVTGPKSPPVSKLEDLSGKEVYIHKLSAFYLAIQKLNERFKAEGRPPVAVKEADPNLTEDDILEMLNAGLIGMTVSRDLYANFWSKIYTDIHPHPEIAVASGESSGFAVRKNTPQLVALLNEFLITHRVGTSFGNTVMNRYLKDTKWVKNSVDQAELQKFTKTVDLFHRYGDQYSLPYLLVAAQAYQESGINQEAKSSVGAVGVMQIKPETAAGAPISIPDVHTVDKNIEAGTKYFRFMMDRYFKNEPMDQINKGLFTLASYNAGPGRVANLRKKAAAEGLNPNLWFNNVELIASREIGRETVQYVANIYKYYLAYSMVTEQKAKSRQAREQLGKPPAGKE
jgi:membrane-bound lytic murein transglycosylase MltF